MHACNTIIPQVALLNKHAKILQASHTKNSGKFWINKLQQNDRIEVRELKSLCTIAFFFSLGNIHGACIIRCCQ